MIRTNWLVVDISSKSSMSAVLAGSVPASMFANSPESVPAFTRTQTLRLEMARLDPLTNLTMSVPSSIAEPSTSIALLEWYFLMSKDNFADGCSRRLLVMVSGAAPVWESWP